MSDEHDTRGMAYEGKLNLPLLEQLSVIDELAAYADTTVAQTDALVAAGAPTTPDQITVTLDIYEKFVVSVALNALGFFTGERTREVAKGLARRMVDLNESLPEPTEEEQAAYDAANEAVAQQSLSKLMGVLGGGEGSWAAGFGAEEADEA